MQEYLTSLELEEALLCLKDLNAPDFHGEVVNRAVSLVFDKKERDREEVMKLLVYLKKEGQLTTDDFEKG